MDPRHPELAVSRIKELVAQYDRVNKDMNATVSSSKLAALEREGMLVAQEICLVAPRLYDALVQASRLRRRDLNRPLASFSDKALDKVYESVRKEEHIEDTVDEKEFKDFMEKNSKSVEVKTKKKKAAKKKVEE